MVVHAKKPLPVVDATSPQWLTPAELAARLRIDPNTARRNIYTGQGDIPEGKIPGIRIGRLLRVHIDDVEKFESRNRRQQASRNKKAVHFGEKLLSGGEDHFRHH